MLNPLHVSLMILELIFAQILMLLPSHESIKMFTHYRLPTASVTKLFNLLKMLMMCIMTKFHRLEAKGKLILFHNSSDH